MQAQFRQKPIFVPIINHLWTPNNNSILIVKKWFEQVYGLCEVRPLDTWMMTKESFKAAIRRPKPVAFPGQQQAVNALMSDWDKFCILGIYIKLQPSRNQFTGGANGDTICPIQCTYTMNNTGPDAAPFYDKTNIPNKQVFTFNSNEAFTIYVPAPPTMEVGSSVVQKSKTWWSLTDLVKFQNDFTSVNMQNEDDEEDEEDYEGNLGNPFNPNNQMHAGRICLNSEGAAVYNITINYKIALKG